MWCLSLAEWWVSSGPGRRRTPNFRSPPSTLITTVGSPVHALVSCNSRRWPRADGRCGASHSRNGGFLQGLVAAGLPTFVLPTRPSSQLLGVLFTHLCHATHVGGHALTVDVVPLARCMVGSFSTWSPQDSQLSFSHSTLIT